MIRVMLLATDLQRGGLPLRLARIAPRLRQVGIEPVVGSLAPRGPLSDSLEAQGIQTFSCDARGRFDATCLRRLARWVKRLDPDVVHAALFHANLAARLVGRCDRPRPVMTTTVTIEIERGWHRWLEALTAEMSDIHMVNSEAVAEHVRRDLGFRGEQVVVIPNAIDLDEISRTPPIVRSQHDLADDASLLVWAGRMDAVKDLTTLVRVAEVLALKRRIVVVLLGDGPERRRIEALVSKRRLSQVVRLAGWTDNVLAWFKAADALLLTSRTEGSPNVVLEAVACGCPVVAGDIPSCRELIIDNSIGRLCPPGDVSAFADALDNVLRTDRMALVNSQARQELVSRHDMPEVVGLWRALYNLLSGRSPKA